RAGDLAVEILAGEHRDHALGVTGGRHVDPELRPGDVAAHEVGVQHVREGDVIGVPAPSGEETRVLLAEHRLADVPTRGRVCEGVAHASPLAVSSPIASAPGCGRRTLTSRSGRLDRVAGA